MDLPMSAPRRSATTAGETRFSEVLENEAAAREVDRGRAVRVVAGRSDNVDDCVELLAMLGLSSVAGLPRHPLDGGPDRRV
jgi:hypothetical protein